MLTRSDVPIRDFTDAEGVRWQVWNTVPFTSGVAGSMKDGWLTFNSSLERRRLAPIPPGWENASLSELRMYCDRAVAVGRTPTTGSWRIEASEP